MANNIRNIYTGPLDVPIDLQTPGVVDRFYPDTLTGSVFDLETGMSLAGILDSLSGMIAYLGERTESAVRSINGNYPDENGNIQIQQGILGNKDLFFWIEHNLDAPFDSEAALGMASYINYGYDGGGNNLVLFPGIAALEGNALIFGGMEGGGG